MTRAYVQEFTANHYAVYIETPRGTWVRLKDYATSKEGAQGWATEMGYRVVTKEESYKPK